MAIPITCPACRKAYRLKDEFAGKTVKCANPDCRQPFNVPKPTADLARQPASLNAGVLPAVSAGSAVAPALPPPPPPVDADTLAAQAFAAADQAEVAPVDGRTIAMKCFMCEHEWTEPWDKQGKNVLCPDCRHRQKVPVQKTNQKADWRTGRSGPSMARQEQLDGVIASGDSTYVGGDALRAAGLGRPELEPRPLWQKVAVVAGPLALVAVVVVGVLQFRQMRTQGKETGAMAAALADMPDPAAEVIAKGEAPLAQAALLVSAGEYAARREKATPKDLTDAVQQLGKARQALAELAPSAGRDFLFGELVAAQLLLGGSAEQVEANQRVRWVPQATGAGRARVSEKVYDVQTELRQTFTAMQSADRPTAPDARLFALRRAARAFAASGHPDAAEQLLPVLFADPAEQIDGVAHAGCAAFAAAGDAARASKAVTGVVPTLGQGRPATPALLALAQVAAPPVEGLKLPTLTPAPAEDARAAHGILAILQKKPDAVELAKRPGKVPERLALLALATELGADPAPAVAAAVEILAADGAKKESGGAPADGVLLRLSAAAGRAGQRDAVEALGKAAGRDDVKALVRGEGLKHLWLAANKPVADADAGVPVETRELKLGHLWTRLAQARATAASGEVKAPDAFDGWGKGAGKPFGLAGMALGQQDRSLR